MAKALIFLRWAMSIRGTTDLENQMDMASTNGKITVYIQASSKKG